MELPKVKSKPKTKDPKNLILFGLPKVGKTTLLSKLPKCLIIDLEDGSDYVEAYSIKAKSYTDLFKIAKLLKENPNKFDFVAIDTVTALEELILPYANRLYRESPMGVNFDPEENILKLSNGSGYLWTRIAIQNVIGWFKKVTKNLILIGHVKEKSYNENGTELNIKDFDMTGKVARILSGDSDAICYIYKDVENHSVYGNFGNNNSVLTGSRLAHISGRNIKLSELNPETNEITTFWEEIYPSLKEVNNVKES